MRARWRLSRLNQATAPSKEWLLQVLKDGDIAPVIPANSLCSFEPIIAIRQEGSTTPVPFPAVVVAPGKDSPSTLPAARAGRLLNTFENFLVGTVIGCLKSAGWEHEESYRLLRDIMIYCFGADVSAAALGKQWRRRLPTKSHT